MADFEFEPVDKEPSFSSDPPPTREQTKRIQRKSRNQNQSRTPPPVNEQPANPIDIGEIASFIFGLVILAAMIYGVFYIGSVVVDWFADKPTVTEQRRGTSINSNNRTRNEPQSIQSPIPEQKISVRKLSNIQSGTCDIGKFRSQGGAITLGSRTAKTNWRKIEFIYCVETDSNGDYLIAEAYGNKAVGYLVIDNKSPLSKSSIYGCVLHSKYKVIRKKPASFLPITCSETSLRSLR